MQRRGFTIVELLIVIVVIAILAVITIVAYNGIQQRAHDSQRKEDIATIRKALEMYYVDNGKYPAASFGSTTINSGWATTADASWANLATVLKPYLPQLPRDPFSSAGVNIQGGTPGYNYAYFGDYSGTYCSTTPAQTYILLYRLEGTSQTNDLDPCTAGTNLGPYAGAINIRRVK